MYIRSSPRGPSRDPNRTLSNELLLYKYISTQGRINILTYLYIKEDFLGVQLCI